ncbi:MAG: ATPase [Chitinophagia bacterium]|nr:ATPase [Chitinophagia bacterium]
MIKKIVIVGPESTGKSTLCKELAKHYQTMWCPEYARAYLHEHGTKYQFDDLLKIAKGQLALEDQTTALLEDKQRLSNESNKVWPLFIDTDMYVMKVWCEFVFKKCHRFVLDQIVKRRYDHYLLCNTDLPWVQDELREYPDLATREKLFRMYKDCLINQSVEWTLISGTESDRLGNAIATVDQLLH